jgi:lipopolysaccharide export system protein LptA
MSLQARLPLFLLVILLAGQGQQPAMAFDVTGRTAEPVKVQADWAELDERTGDSTYRGNVVVRQGRSMIEASEIRIKAGDNGIVYFIATGEPAHMLIYDAEKSEETHAYAKNMEFEQSKSRVTLSVNARLQQAKSSFQGERIVYNTVTQIVSAESKPGASSEGRVEIIYHPSPKQSEPAP